jgi:hypothetical protein
MKPKIHASQIRIGGPAWEFIREVENSRHTSVKETDVPKKDGATEILESFQENDKDPNEIDLAIMDGEFLNRRLDKELTEFRVVPYFLTEEARSKGEGIREGDSAYLLGDDRIFDVVHISYESESIRLRDDNENEFVVPWHLLVPSK